MTYVLSDLISSATQSTTWKATGGNKRMPKIEKIVHVKLPVYRVKTFLGRSLNWASAADREDSKHMIM